MPKQIRKRDGRVVPFDPERIHAAIAKALKAAGAFDEKKAAKIRDETVARLNALDAKAKSGKPFIPSVENVQDIVEKALIESGEAEAAKSYILYRKNRADIREAKEAIGVRDDMKLTLNAIKVLERRYLLKDDEGRVVETPSQLFRRVAHAVAQADLNYGGEEAARRAEEDFYAMMANFEFMPNSPTLMNAGTDMGQLSACFVLPVGDSIEEIFTTARDMALIHQSGGGTGFSFSRLRPKGDLVRSTHGVASGPVSFITVYDAATEVIKQGGRRRGANMGILRVDHPDILDFAMSKVSGDKLRNFNVSVAVDDRFMEALATNSRYDLVNPRTGRSGMSLNAADAFDVITTSAWKCGDPGLCFIDEINRGNPTPEVGLIEATNPCGEQPLLPYESCNLGSINLAAMVADGKIDWDKLAATVKKAVHFLDDVIDVSRFPLPQVRSATLANRKVGLGVMGFAEMLVKLGAAYDSDEAIKIGGETMKFITEKARAVSAELAGKRGSFPNFKKSVYPAMGLKALRNATVTSVAPTGTISIIAGCSSGIEPLFSLSFYRHVMGDAHLLEKNALFEETARREKFYSDDMMAEVARRGSLAGIPGVPEKVRRLFVTAFDVAPDWHVKMQAAFQKFTDNGVSKTVNLPQEAAQADVRRIYLLAHQLRCKGITIYRYGSKPQQVLTIEEEAPSVSCE